MFERRKPYPFKDQVRRSFGATSTGYGRPGDFHWEFAQRLVERAPVAAGQTVIDVATGTAPAAIMAAERVGRAGRVVGIDLSLGMVTLARQHIAAAGLDMLLLVGDAEALPVATGGVDGVLCSSAIVWFPNMLQALREWYRVLRPGGWIAFSCFGGLARQTFDELVIRLLAPHGVGYPELNAPLNSPEKCRAVVGAAGFTRVTVQIAQEQQFATDPDVSFRQAWASGTRFDLALSPAVVSAIKTQYTAHFEQLLASQDHWNHDYEQFVVAYK